MTSFDVKSAPWPDEAVRLYRQATNKIAGLSAAAADVLREFF